MKIELRDILVHLPVTGKTLFRLKHFAVESGQRVLIQGESGKGKTTLLHLMAGLFFPSEGYVELGSQRLNNLNDEERCRFRRENIGIIFQKLNLIEHLTAVENIELAVGLKGEARALKALKDVGLQGHGKERSSVLSLGEQQRVAVARVLAADVKLILADEPTSSLDQRNSGKIIELLFEAAKGKTLVVVSHDHRIEDKFDHVLQFENLIQPGTGG